jgi:hypothetical protein
MMLIIVLTLTFTLPAGVYLGAESAEALLREALRRVRKCARKTAEKIKELYLSRFVDLRHLFVGSLLAAFG